VGFTAAPKSLHVTSTSDINTDLIKTTSTQAYDSAVTLKAATTNLQGSTVTLGAPLNTDGVATTDLTVTGNAAFDRVGNVNQLGSVHVTSATAINKDIVSTTGTQAYDGAVTLKFAAIGLTGST